MATLTGSGHPSYTTSGDTIVRALQTCPDGRDHIAKHMLMLSTYLGHSKAALTYWYLEAVPELMRGIADCSEAYLTGGTP